MIVTFDLCYCACVRTNRQTRTIIYRSNPKAKVFLTIQQPMLTFSIYVCAAQGGTMARHFAKKEEGNHLFSSQNCREDALGRSLTIIKIQPSQVLWRILNPTNSPQTYWLPAILSGKSNVSNNASVLNFQRAGWTLMFLVLEQVTLSGYCIGVPLGVGMVPPITLWQLSLNFWTVLIHTQEYQIVWWSKFPRFA